MLRERLIKWLVSATSRLPTAYPATDKINIAAQEAKWRAESDLRTLQSAAEIQADKSRLAAAKKCADEQVKALQKIK